MEWRHNLVVENTHAPLTGIALTYRDAAGFLLWIVDPQTLTVRRLPFDAQGVIGHLSTEQIPLYDALLPHPGGYVLADCRAGAARLSGHTSDHREAWTTTLPDADSPRWSLVVGADATFHIFYSSCNPHDAHRQARVVTVNPAAGNAPEEFFTVPDDDFPMAQIAIAQPQRLIICARSRGAATIFYTLSLDGEIIRDGAFTAHPHSRWAVPLCHTPLEDGDILMGGYKEEKPGRRRAWVCRFDADLSALNGKVVAGDAEEQAVTAFAPQPDGTVLALCPPLRILRFSDKGLLTHEWEVPSSLRSNALTAILSAPGGGCFITGRSYSGKEDARSPAVWLGKIGLNEFSEL